MERFVIGSEEGAKVAFHSRQFDDSKWLESYAVDIEANGFRVSVRVENPGCGHPPSQLFLSLAPQWKGLKGAESWSAMEGELEIEATSDSLGHFKLEFSLPGYAEASCWSARAWVVVEAGKLEQLATEAHEFFSRGA